MQVCSEKNTDSKQTNIRDPFPLHLYCKINNYEVELTGKKTSLNPCHTLQKNNTLLEKNTNLF